MLKTCVCVSVCYSWRGALAILLQIYFATAKRGSIFCTQIYLEVGLVIQAHLSFDSFDSSEHVRSKRHSAASVAPANFTEEIWTKLFFHSFVYSSFALPVSVWDHLAGKEIALQLGISQSYLDPKKDSGKFSRPDKCFNFKFFPRKSSSCPFCKALSWHYSISWKQKLTAVINTSLAAAERYLLSGSQSIDWSVQRLPSGALLQLHGL